MTTASDIKYVAQEINSVINNTGLVNDIQQLSKVTRLFPGNVAGAQQQAFAIFDKISSTLGAIPVETWKIDQTDALDKLDLSKWLGQTGKRNLELSKSEIQANPANGVAVITKIFSELNALRTKVTQLANVLQPFEIVDLSYSLQGDKAILELTFAGEVRIEDFPTAKEQMHEWFLIVDGYARTVGANKEDFKIIGISKNSPTKFKIQTTATIAGLVLGIISTLLIIEKTVLERKIMIEKLKQNPIVQDSTMHTEYVGLAEKEIKRIVEKEIEELANKKMSEHSHDRSSAGDIKTSLVKSIENQYNFLISGGNVNVYINDNTLRPQVDAIEKTKNELQQIRDSYENIKSIDSSSSSTSIQ
jgi:hypothetical protein